MGSTISKTFKPGVSSLKPGDRVRETSSVTDFIADYIVLSAKCPNNHSTYYKLYTTYTNQASSQWDYDQRPGHILIITEPGDLFEGKSIQWSRI